MRFWNTLCPMLGPEKEPQATKIDVGLGASWLGCMGVLYQGLNLKKQHLLVLLTIQLLFGQLTLSLYNMHYIPTTSWEKRGPPLLYMMKWFGNNMPFTHTLLSSFVSLLQQCICMWQETIGPSRTSQALLGGGADEVLWKQSASHTHTCVIFCLAGAASILKFASITRGLHQGMRSVFTTPRRR